jgi:hypothetical protein
VHGDREASIQGVLSECVSNVDTDRQNRKGRLRHSELVLTRADAFTRFLKNRFFRTSVSADAPRRAVLAACSETGLPSCAYRMSRRREGSNTIVPATAFRSTCLARHSESSIDVLSDLSHQLKCFEVTLNQVAPGACECRRNLVDAECPSA